jgi:hypothetical protein
MRGLIRDDGAKLEMDAHRSVRYTANALLTTASLLSPNPNPPYLQDGGHAVLNAADERIRGLLQLKREHSCPARPTALP